jgi:hypothetical protein
MFFLFAIKGLVFNVVHYITLRGFVGLVSWARGQNKMSKTHSRSKFSKV